MRVHLQRQQEPFRRQLVRGLRGRHPFHRRVRAQRDHRTTPSSATAPGEVCRHALARLVGQRPRQLLERQSGLRPQRRRHRRHSPTARTTSSTRSSGRYPAAKLLLNSPAVQVVRWAQSRFPAIHPGGVIDSAPLMSPPAVRPRRGWRAGRDPRRRARRSRQALRRARRRVDGVSLARRRPASAWPWSATTAPARPRSSSCCSG